MIVNSSRETILSAARQLLAGDVLGLPTETVYGLAANASDVKAVSKIYTTKGRPADHPLIVHLAPKADIAFWAQNIPSYAIDLMTAFWPGPLTIVLPRTAQAGDFVTGGQDTVALRCPSHPVAQAVLNICLDLGIQGLAAPSANRFGRVSPTTAQHVEDEFEGCILTIDGGACEVGIESTIVDCTQASPHVLRHGAITSDDIARVTDLSASNAAALKSRPRTTPRVSGSLAAHYAPATPVRFCHPSMMIHLPANTVYMGFSAPDTRPSNIAAFHAMPQDATQYAQQLYAALRTLDTMQFSQIAVEPVPRTDAWAGVADRLTRAAATFD